MDHLGIYDKTCQSLTLLPYQWINHPLPHHPNLQCKYSVSMWHFRGLYALFILFSFINTMFCISTVKMLYRLSDLIVGPLEGYMHYLFYYQFYQLSTGG